MTLAVIVLGRAQAQERPAVAADWWDQPTMTGDWGGLRQDLEGDGVTIHSGYVGEMAGNPVGGKSQGFAYAHQVELGAEIDLLKLSGVNLGILSVSFTERAGSSLSADRIGDIEEVQEDFGSGETVRLVKFALRRALGPHFEAGIGWNDSEEDFASSSIYWGHAIYCAYQSLAFCGKPPALGQNSGYTFIPRAVPAGWVKLYPTRDHSIVLGAGIYAAEPSIPNAHNGFKLGLDDTTGAFLPVELGWHRGGSDAAGQLPGMYRIGVYYDTSRVRDVAAQAKAYIPSGTALTALPTGTTRGRYGGWLLGDQMIERDGLDSSRGTVLWSMLTYGDPETALLPYYGAVGLVRRGTFSTRPSDLVAVGFFAAAVNSRLAAYEGLLQRRGLSVPTQSQELGLEANYGYQATGWFLLRPGVQYVWHPAGENEIPNALVLDLQTTVNF